MIRMLQASAIAIALVAGQILAHDDKPKPKPKPEAAKDVKDGKGDGQKTGGHKGKDHDKKH